MEDRLLTAVGLADVCEIMAKAWAFPEENLAAALVGGSFARDVEACLLDSGYADEAARALEELGSFGGRDASELLGAMRKGHSVLYLMPGTDVPVWPYESAFRLRESGSSSVPSLFRSQTTVDVERHMREAGVLPKDARQEPADSVWDEFSFMAYLYGSEAKALHEDREADAAEWRGRAARFWEEHAAKWLPTFMARTIEIAPGCVSGEEYAILAKASLFVLEAIAADARAVAL